MKTNQAGLDLIKRFEGFRADAYLCPADVWTIGYGHTSAAGAPEVKRGMKVTEPEATVILMRDLGTFEAAVERAISRPMTGDQFSAMVSLAFNIGPGAFAKSSVARLFNAGDVQGAADAFRLWNKGGGKVLPGLIRRREEERALFLRPSASEQPKPVEPVPAPPEPMPPQTPETPPAASAAPARPGADIARWVIGAAAALIAALAAWMMKG